MIGVTADSNIFISGWFTQGRRADFWMIARARLFQLSFSTPLLDEICRYYWISSSGRKNGLTICRSAWRKFTQRVHPTITTGCREKRSRGQSRARMRGGSRSLETTTYWQLSHYSGIQIVKVADFYEAPSIALIHRLPNLTDSRFSPSVPGSGARICAVSPRNWLRR